MTPADFAVLRDNVTGAEGCRLKPYTDTMGKLTIGYGRNLSDVGISQDEANDLLEHDLKAALFDLCRAYPVVLTLSSQRQIALAEMAFNLGIAKLSMFTHMWANILGGNFEAASVEALDSTWAEQVGGRATRIAAMLLKG